MPAIASGAAAELDPLRAACDRALEIVLRSEPAVVTLVGTGPQARQYFPPFVADFAGFGVDVGARLGGGTRPGVDELPLSLAIGVWLVRRAQEAGLVHRPTTWATP